MRWQVPRHIEMRETKRQKKKEKKRGRGKEGYGAEGTERIAGHNGHDITIGITRRKVDPFQCQGIVTRSRGGVLCAFRRFSPRHGVAPARLRLAPFGRSHGTAGRNFAGGRCRRPRRPFGPRRSRLRLRNYWLSLVVYLAYC